jgi:deoxyribonuclease V
LKTLRLNRWDVTYRQAVAIQDRLRKRIVRRGGPVRIRLVAGADVSYEKADDRFYAAVVVMTYPELRVVEQASASGRARFPYIPGLLTFREGPILLEAFEKIRSEPDLVIFDGQGYSHPRRLGLASHMGLLLDVPSIGCAKTRLCGEHTEPGRERGSTAALRHSGELVGRVVRTRTGVKPVYVSVGHRISLSRAVKWVLATCRGLRLPEPTRQAHMLVNSLRKEAGHDRV